MSQIKINLPETLRYQLEITARDEGVSLEQYIVFALTRQTILTSVICNIPEEDTKHQSKDFIELKKRLGKASPEELDKVLQEREFVEPEQALNVEVVLRLKNRIADAKMSSMLTKH